ncbi:hypothetical protein A2U01_0067412, partial [Trifolium medium]|nr:hypothetical protein [Trifolium medium]
PPAPNVDLYKPRKRKRNVKSSEEEPKKKEMKKENVDSSGKEKVIVAEKEEVIVAEKEEVVATEVGKKKEKKRKSYGIKIVEGRTKTKHDKRSKKDDSSTESDEETLA